MASTKSSRVNPKYKKRYRVGNWPAYERGLRARGERHRLVRRRGPQYVDPASDPLSWRAAALLGPGDPDGADPAHALPPAASAD